MKQRSQPQDSDAEERRRLRFETIDDAVAEANRIVSADRDGHLISVGTWTAGQTLGHLTTWANFAFDGYPPEVRAPLPVRMILRLMRNQILNKGMMPGVKIRGIPGGTLGLEIVPADEALPRYKAAMARLSHNAPTIQNPVFGVLSHDQWIALNLRHAELHFAFLKP